MATFPENILPVYPVVIEPVWDTLVSTFDSGGEQRRQKSLYPRFNVQLKYRALSAADAQTMWDFYMARKGAFESFYFFDPAPDIGITTTYKGLYVGTGDGTTDIFDLPGKSTSSQTVYVDGVAGSYSILTGGGDGGADRVDFVAAPATGESISCDFTGKLRINCRFAQDRLSKELFMTVLYNFGIELKGLAGN